MKFTLLPVICLLALLANAHADDDFHDSNGHLWFTSINTIGLGNSPWSLHLEGQARRAEMGDEWQQWLVRPGLNYAFSPTVQFSAGWAYADTYRYGSYPAAFDFPEHRAWEQMTVSTRALGLEWQHRFRLEQRWIGEMEGAGNDWQVENWRYENRFRYLLRTSLPLTESKKTSLILWNEVMFNFGSNVSGNHFDQNRAFIGIGHKLSDRARLEFGFIEQTIQRRGGQIWEHNHTLALWFITNWPSR